MAVKGARGGKSPAVRSRGKEIVVGSRDRLEPSVSGARGGKEEGC